MWMCHLFPAETLTVGEAGGRAQWEMLSCWCLWWTFQAEETASIYTLRHCFLGLFVASCTDHFVYLNWGTAGSSGKSGLLWAGKIWTERQLLHIPQLVVGRSLSLSHPFISLIRKSSRSLKHFVVRNWLNSIKWENKCLINVSFSFLCRQNSCCNFPLEILLGILSRGSKEIVRLRC